MARLGRVSKENGKDPQSTYTYREKKKARGTSNFEWTDGIRRYGKLIFDTFTTTTTELGGMGREFSYINYMHHGTGVKANESENVAQRKRKSHR